ncbi:MAG: hypothetical protein KF716_26120 [Anaerolineae bacterium]|nr:hypothetical protein [Anaerolineae bacterium]
MSDATPTPIPVMPVQEDGPFKRLNAFLDKYVLPYPVRYLTNRLTILATLGLLIPLIFFTKEQAFVNTLNSYLNVMSVVVSSTVLLYSTISEARDRIASARREQIAALHQAKVDERAQEDHERIEQMHQHLDELRREVMDHVSTSLNEIQKILMERLDTMHSTDQAQLTAMHEAVMDANQRHHEQIAALSAMVESLKDDGSNEE